MNFRRIASAMTAAACSAGFIVVAPELTTRTYAAEVVYNGFETDYEGWIEEDLSSTLTAVNGAGYDGTRGMRLSNRPNPEAAAASSKGLYLVGGVEYDYNVKVSADTDETFHVTLLYKDLETDEETVVELASAFVKAGEWKNLSAKYKAPENTYEYKISITTETSNDFYFDDVLITEERDANAVSAASTQTGLKDEFAGYFRVGNIFNGTTINNSSIQAIILKDHNAVECENETKPDATIVQSGSTNTNVKVTLNRAASIIDFCAKNKIAFRGHTLVWHSQTPEWFFKTNFDANGSYVGKDTMNQRMESYIKNMFNEYATKYPSLELYAYDVCNEVINDGTANQGGLRPTSGNGRSAWVQVYGDNSFVEQAFTYARKYAPKTCKLFYNDYNEFATDKQNCIINTIIKPLKAKGLIDGMGMQSHLNCAASGAWGDTNSYLAAMDKYLNLGIDVQVTELDLARENGNYSEQQQSDKYCAIFKHCMDWNKNHPGGANVTLVQVWGPTDTNSWVQFQDSQTRTKPNYPLLYNGNYQPKQAYNDLLKLVPSSQWGTGIPYTGPGSTGFVPTPVEPVKPDTNGYYFHHTFEGTEDGWETRFCDSVKTSGRASYAGSESLLVDGRTKSWNGAKFAIDSNPFEPGQSFAFSANVCYLDGDAESDTFMLKLEYTGTDGEAHYSEIASGTAPKGEWLQLYNPSYTIPDDVASGMAIYVETAENAAAEYNNFYIDEVIGAVENTKISGAGTPTVRTVVLGDIDFDGAITSFDVALGRMGLIEGGFADAKTKKAADVDRNGKYEIADLVLIMQYVLGDIEEFPKAQKNIDFTEMEQIFKSVTLNSSWKPDGENNPLTTQRFGADPGWLVYDGRLYLYTTNDAFEYQSNGNMQENTYNSGTINCVSSADLVNWTDHGAIPIAARNGRTQNGVCSWASAAWAPDACWKMVDGKPRFYLFFANSGGGIGVVVGDSPTGPWVDGANGALLSHNSPNCSDVEWMFDPGVYYDEKSDECYVFFGGGRKNGIPADSPGTGRVVKVNLLANKVTLACDPVKMDIPYLFEDSSVIKIDDTWYYSYCSNWDVGNQTVNGVNFGNADILYMKSTDPLKWDKSKLAGNVFKNTGSQRIDNGGNNHHSIIYFKNKYYVAYHSRKQAMRMTDANGYKFYNTRGELTNSGDGNYRSTQINECTFSNGKLSCSGDMKGTSQIEALDPYKKIEAETMSNQSKKIVVNGVGNTTVHGSKGEWIKVSGADFSNGCDEFTLRASSSNGAAIKICVGSASATGDDVIGYVDIPAGGSYSEETVAVNSITGSNNIYFVFSGDADLDWWQFN